VAHLTKKPGKIPRNGKNDDDTNAATATTA